MAGNDEVIAIADDDESVAAEAPSSLVAINGGAVDEQLEMLAQAAALVETGDVKGMVICLQPRGSDFVDALVSTGINTAEIIGLLDLCKARVIDENLDPDSYDEGA